MAPNDILLLAIFVLMALTFGVLNEWPTLPTAMRDLGRQIFGDRMMKLIENPLTLFGCGAVITAMWPLLDSERGSPLHWFGVAMLCVAWTFFALGIQRSGYFSARSHRRIKKAASLVASAAILFVAFWWLPSKRTEKTEGDTGTGSSSPKQGETSPIGSTTQEASSTESEGAPTSTPRPHGKPLLERGEALCNDLSQSAKDWEQEEPTVAYRSNYPPEVLQSQLQNKRNFDARVDQRYNSSKYPGPLREVVKELKDHGIQPEMSFDGVGRAGLSGLKEAARTLCEMVGEYEQKSGLAPTASHFKFGPSQSSSLPCFGKPATDDPFPNERNEQIGVRLVDRAKQIEKLAEDCKNDMSKIAGHDKQNARRKQFVSEISQCCLDDIGRLHYAAVSRCIDAQNADGELHYRRFMENDTYCHTREVASYLRQLGQRLKDID
jgi:hypothetical protein